MFKKISLLLLGTATIFSGGSYLLDNDESHKAYAKEVVQVAEVLEAKETAVIVSDFAYLEPANEYFTFLEEEVKRKEMEEKKLAEEIRLAEEKKEKEIQEKLAKIESDKKAKEEAERKAKEKAEAEKQAKIEAEKAAKAEAERKAQEEKAKAAAKAEAERVAKYNEAQAVKAKLKKEEEAKKAAQAPAQPKKSSTPAASGNVEALAKIIHAEAKGEPYQGKVAVGAVVLNRVDDGRFPNSVTGVIFQPKQFQPVTNGAYQSARPSNADYQAAREALNGADPTGGATFFYAPSIATTSWHETLTPTVTIGAHRFFKN